MHGSTGETEVVVAVSVWVSKPGIFRFSSSALRRFFVCLLFLCFSEFAATVLAVRLVAIIVPRGQLALAGPSGSQARRN